MQQTTRNEYRRIVRRGTARRSEKRAGHCLPALWVGRQAGGTMDPVARWSS